MIQSGSMEMVMLKNVLCARCDKRIPVDSQGFAMLDCECMYDLRNRSSSETEADPKRQVEATPERAQVQGICR